MTDDKGKGVDISVIVPCYNEAENIEPLVREICEVLRPLGRPFEILYVDDGSTDGTLEQIRETANSFPELRSVTHHLNLGQSAAFMTGFHNTNGQILVTLDADMQNDPHDVPRLLEELESCDMVCGVRKKRRDNFIRRASTFIANKVRNFFLKDGIIDSGCGFRVFRRRVLIQLIAFKGLHRFLPTLCRIHGFKIKQIPVNHRPRYKGVSKYGISNRLFVGVHDMFAIHWYRKRHIPVKRK